MEPEETARTLKLKKFIYGGLFNEEGKILLCNDGKNLRLPGGAVYVADVCQFDDERWIPVFLSRKIETDTGITSSLIKEGIQPLAATYNTYPNDFREEYSAIIVGHIVDSEQVIKENASFFDAEDILTISIFEKIKKHQLILIMRIFASRDCPSSYSRKISSTWLKSHT